MAEFTVLKLEFPNAELTANAPYSGSGEAEIEVENEDDDSESRSVLPILLGLLFLVVVAVVVKKVLGGEETDSPGDDSLRIDDA